MRQGRWLLLFMALLLCGCSTFVAYEIGHPGHSGDSFQSLEEMLTSIGFSHRIFRTSEGVVIAYTTAPPRAYAFTDRVKLRSTQGRVSGFDSEVQFVGDPTHAKLIPAKGSVLLLHPWGGAGSLMMAWALHFSSAGYVVVAPDLRGQGRSSDAPVGYGPREAGDMQQLVAALRADGQLPDPLFLLGASYGGTVALFAAPEIPGVRGVVALEPYANAGAVIRRAPHSGLFGYRWLARWITPTTIDRAIDKADHRLGLDLDAIRPDRALALTHSCTLVVRGARDHLMQADALRRLSKLSPRASYVEVPGENHMTLPLRTDRLFDPILRWMQSLPAVPDAASCASLVLPKAPDKAESAP